MIDDLVKNVQNDPSKVNYFLLSLGTGRLINDAIPESAGIMNLAPIIDSFTESANFFIEKVDKLQENLNISVMVNIQCVIDLHFSDRVTAFNDLIK